MTGFLGSLFRVNKPSPPETMLRVQSSIEGRPIAIGAGQNRVTANTVSYDDFRVSKGSSGGKGAGGSSGKGNTGNYTYSATFIQSIGQGPLSVQSIINGNQIDFLVTPSAQTLADLALLNITPTYGDTWSGTFFAGDWAQTPWSYMVTNHPAKALSYRGEALAAYANLGLGNSASLPNFNYEVLWGINSDVPSLGPDANPADWITAYLSNSDWGIGFPAALIDDLTAYRTWARATGLLISPVLTSQQAGQSHLADIMTATSADFRWSNGKLGIVPYADHSVTGNGTTYTASVTPVYDLTVDDFLENQGSLGSAVSGVTPIVISRKDPTQIINRLQLEYLDRANLYNPKIIYETDDANITAARRLRMSDLRAHHFFCLPSAAAQSAALQLQREKILRQFQFTLPPQFILLDPLDIVTLTETNLGLVRQPVRITEIQENNDRSLTMTAEEFLGAVTPPLYTRQLSIGGGRNTNIDPGPINTPVIFEPPDALAQNLDIWMAVSGQNTSLWGGCTIWVSSSASGTYTEVATVNAPARQGVLTSSLPTVTASTTGQTIDATNTLGVSLAMSAGSLASGSSADMTSLNTASYVDGEIIAYQTATLIGTNAYALAPMVRGAYGTPISAHASGTQFARLDGSIVKYPFTQDRIGQTLYFKFTSFNIYGGGEQNLADVSPVTYVVQGTALASPLPNVTNLRTVFEAGVMKVYWDEVTDFRPVQYEWRKGLSWDTGVKVSRQAHPPFTVLGDDTYWLAAVSQPTAGLTVYSAAPSEITVSGSLLSLNIIRSVNEQTSLWSGVRSSGVILQGSGSSQTLALDGATYTGTYTGSNADIIDVGYVAPALVGASYVASGSPAGQNILAINDFLGTADILGSGAGKYVDVHLEISFGVGTADMFAVADIFGVPDFFTAGIAWSPWQKFVPGVYYGRYFWFRAVLSTVTLQAVPNLLSMSYQVTVPTRIDHYVNQSVGTGGLAIVYRPDGAATTAPFNGGLNGAALPNVYVTWQNQPGDSYTLTSNTLLGVTITFFNGGSPVARTATIEVQGY